MGYNFGTILASLGIVLTAGGIVLLLRASGLLGTGTAATELIMIAMMTFLVGIFVFGYGAGKRLHY